MEPLFTLKVNPPKFRFIESLRHTAIWIFAPIQQEAKHDQEPELYSYTMGESLDCELYLG